MVDQVLVVVRSAHHSNFVAEFGRAIGKGNRFSHALGARTGDQELLRRGVLCYPFPELGLLISCQRHAFAGGTADDITRQTRQVPFLDIVLNLDFPEITFGIKRRGYRRENTLQFEHDRMCGRLVACGGLLTTVVLISADPPPPTLQTVGMPPPSCPE